MIIILGVRKKTSRVSRDKSHAYEDYVARMSRNDATFARPSSHGMWYQCSPCTCIQEYTSMFGSHKAWRIVSFFLKKKMIYRT